MSLVGRPDPNRCPGCRERVSPFAAGCALCGAELDPLRHRRGPGAVQRLGSAFTAFGMGPRPQDLLPRWRSDPRQIAVVAVVALCSCTLIGIAAMVLFYGVSALLPG